MRLPMVRRRLEMGLVGRAKWLLVQKQGDLRQAAGRVLVGATEMVRMFLKASMAAAEILTVHYPSCSPGEGRRQA